MKTVDIKRIVSVLLVLGLGASLMYVLFVPEFMRSKVIDHIYVYIENGDFLKNKYFVKYDDAIDVYIDTDEFSIYLPYAYYHKTEWQYIDNTDQGVEFIESSMIKPRQPIILRLREGEDYRMQALKFKPKENVKGNMVFYYEAVDTDGEKIVNRIIVNIKN
ncbi:MAG: hypothetical protein LR001_02745 [Clostridiales bacterium]|nr:hypothetical protein [Clostridiales bacterium]